jgi:hypothetical protein
MTEITYKSSACETAERIVTPYIRLLQPEKAFDLIKSIENAISMAASPPEWLNAGDAVAYVRWKYKIGFTGKDRPPYRPIGNVYKRADIDAWAVARIEARPAIEHAR